MLVRNAADPLVILNVMRNRDMGQVGKWMSLYLETNTVRSLARWIRRADTYSMGDSFTSFLVIFELLSGTTEEDFTLRRAVLSDILGSFLRVDWRSPITIMSESFDAVGLEDPLGKSLQLIADVYVQSATWKDTCAACTETGQRDVIDTLLNADTLLTLHSKADQEAKGRQFRQDINKKVRKHVREIILESDEEKYTEIKNHFRNKNYQWLLLDTAFTVASFLPGENLVDKSDRLLRTYNGSIDYFLKASAVTQAKNLLAGTQPGDNDYYDVSHFLYVNNDVTIVSDDKLVRNVCGELWPSQIMSARDFASLKEWRDFT